MPDASARAWLMSWVRMETGLCPFVPLPDEWDVRMGRIDLEHALCADLQARALGTVGLTLSELADEIDALGHICSECGGCFVGLPPSSDAMCKDCDQPGQV